MAPRFFFIVNPHSNSGRTRKNWEKLILPQVTKFFQNFCWTYTEKRSHASLLAHYAKKNNFHTVVAVGGDGTINEIVNGLLENTLLSEKHRVPHIFSEGYMQVEMEQENLLKVPNLAFLPTGTGCDFIKSLNIPHHISSALQVIKENKTILCDVGIIEYSDKIQDEIKDKKRYFINMASCGASGEAIKRFNESKKYFGSSGSYMFATLKTILKNKNFNVRIVYDDLDSTETDLAVFFICNGQYCGGGMRVGKNASLQDGLFHTIQIKKMSLLQNILSVNRLYSGNFNGLNKYIIERTAKKITIYPSQKHDILTECDGEQPGILPATFSIVPRSISICINANSK